VSRSTCWLLGALAALIWAGPAFPLDRDRMVSQFQHKSWTSLDGAPVGMSALAQTSDGFLWIGTSGAGLYRFDGIRFESYEPRVGRLLSKDISALASTPEGGLWVGFHTGGASFLLNDKAVSYGEPEGLPGAKVHRLWLGADGVPWAATTRGLFRFENARWVQAGEAWGLPLDKFTSGFVDSRGSIWATSNDTLFRLRSGSGRFEVVMKVRPSPPSSSFGLFGGAATPDGRIWIADNANSELLSLDPDTPARAPAADETGFRAATIKGVYAVTADRDGTLWISTDDGLARYSEGRSGDSPIDLFETQDGLSGNRTRYSLEDREGNIWVTTQRGLDRFTRSKVVPSRLPEEFRDTEGLALAPDRDGSLWIGAYNLTRPLLHLQGDRLSVLELSWPVPLTCLYEDSGGVLWIGGDGKLARLVGGRLEFVEPPAGLFRSGVPAEVQAMTADSEGRLWVSVIRHGLYRLQNGEWQLSGGLVGLPSGAAFAAWTDPQGRVWLGYPANRAVMIDGEQVHVYSSGAGLTLGDITAVSGSGSQVWLGGDGGLALFDGATFRMLASWPVDRIGMIKGIAVTPDGDLWLNQITGLVHVAATVIATKLKSPRGPLRRESFDSLDGVVGYPDLRPSPAAVLTQDGRVWISRTLGVSWVDTRDLRKNPVIPPVLIRSFVVDGKTYLPGSPIVLPVLPANLQIDYTALSLSLPERMQFRYRLDGVDHDWRDVGGRRSAYYTNLAPGRYRFHVIASNNDGVWNTTGATIDFEVPPTFYQTTAFVTACVAAALLGLWLLYLARLRLIVRQLNLRLEERVNERTRIARELHDTLLQSLHGLMFQFQAVRNLLPRRPDEAMQSLDHAIDDTEKALAESRDAIQDLRSEPFARGNLAALLMAASRELAKSGTADQQPPVFELIEEGEKRALSSTAKNEVCRIALEILRNAYRHAHATRIEAEIRYDDRILRIRIRDNGKGIDSRVLTEGGIAGHWGLRGMRERAERIGARLDFWSEAGAGTEVQLTVPADVAYQTAGDDVGSRLLRKVRSRAEHS
jgi:signal transduction histidine kinase/ligand-binding sensor domain-containing protein